MIRILDYALWLLERIWTAALTIEHHGGFVNLATGYTIPLRIGPAIWRGIQNRRKGNGVATNRFGCTGDVDPA